MNFPTILTAEYETRCGGLDWLWGGGGGMLLISTTQLQSSVKLCELIFEDAIAAHMVQY